MAKRNLQLVEAEIAQFRQAEAQSSSSGDRLCPDLNPQEHVWSQARVAVSHNHTYSTFQQLKQAFLDFLSRTVFRFDWLAKYAPSILFDV